MTKPPIITTNKVLPFDALEPGEFERMCLWLVQREGYLHFQHLGEAGSEEGRDIVAYKATDAGEELWYFQCKRYKRINAATLKQEVDKYNRLAKSDPTCRPVGVVFATSAVVSARSKGSVAAYCREYGYACEFWAHSELDMRVKKHLDIVQEFFDASSELLERLAKEMIQRLEALSSYSAPRADITTVDGVGWSEDRLMIMALSRELYAHCYTTLLKWGDINDCSRLQAICRKTPELSNYHDSFPQCRTKEDQVRQTIAYLLPKRLSGNRPVLSVFLEALRDDCRYGDPLCDDLNEISEDVRRMLRDKVFIPFAVAAMTQVQASELAAETVFDNPDVALTERIHFQKFKQALHEYGLDDLPPYYGEEPESWKPLVWPCNRRGEKDLGWNEELENRNLLVCPSINEIIYDTLGQVNNHRQELSQDSRCLLPDFLSEGFFADDRTMRRQASKQLRQSGGILIIDAVSMFHPTLNRHLLQSTFGLNESVAILVVSPIDTSTLPINHLIEEAIEWKMEPTFTRFDGDLDYLCEIGVGDLRALRRWLLACLPATAANIQKQKPSPVSQQQLRAMRREKSHGINRAFFGQGGT